LRAYEEERPPDVSPSKHEQNWEHYHKMRQELAGLQRQMEIYADVLAEIAGAK
jgi:hypothetical protein